MIYNILCDGVNIYDATPTGGLLSPKMEIAVNEAGNLTFSMLPTHQYYDSIHSLTSSIEVYEGEESIFYGRVLDITIDFLKRKNITCEGSFGFFYDTILSPIIFAPSEQDPPVTQQTTLHNLVSYLITEHNKLVDVNRQFQVGNLEVPDQTISFEIDYDRTIDCLKKLIDSFGGYFFVRREEGVNYLDWIPEFLDISSQDIQYAVNLTDINQDFKAADMITSIIPIGDDGLDVSGKDETTGEYYNKKNPGQVYIDSDAVDTYGRVLEKVNFDGVTDPVILYNRAIKWMADKQFDASSIDVCSADLSYFNSDYGVYKLGQLVHVISGPHSVDVNLPIMKISYNLDSPIKDITIGTPPRQDLTEMTVNAGTGGGGGGSADKSTVKRIATSVSETVVAEEVPEIISDKVTVTTILGGGLKIGEIDVNGTTNALYTNVLSGSVDPDSSLGVNGSIYIEYLCDYIEYVRTNYSGFVLTLSNWPYDKSDKFELTYKMADNPGRNTTWPQVLVTNGLATNFNLWGGRKVFNINYNGTYTGDSYIRFESPLDYTNYYKIVANGGSFTIKKGSTLDDINTVAATWSATTVSGSNASSVRLFGSNGQGTMDICFYGLKVWNSSDKLIHNYIPINDGVYDAADGTKYLYTGTGHINGPVSEKTNAIDSIWIKEDGTWKKKAIGAEAGTLDYEELQNLPSINDVTLIGDKTSEDLGIVITLSQDEYDALEEEEKLDLSKVYYISDGEGGGGGGASSISELEDVELTDLADGEILKYDSVLEKWVNAEDGGGGGTSPASNVFSYKTNVTTNQYGWFVNIPDKYGVPLDVTKDVIIDIQTDDNTTSPYYGFQPVTLNGYYIAKVMDRGNNEVVNSTITINNVRVSYIKDYYTKGIISKADVSGTVVGLPALYSENEKMVGLWTDNKPLYQKTYVVTNITTQTVTLDTVSNIDRLVDFSGTYTRILNGVRTLYEIDGRTESASYNNYGWTWGISDDGRVYVTSYGYNISEIDSIAVTIQYTKSTDTPVEDFNLQDFGIFAPVIYSLEEREIGVWTDGKPLYQKTVDCGAIPNNTTKTVAHGISNIAKIVKYEGMAMNSSGNDVRCMPYVGFSDWSVSLYANETNISIHTRQSWSNEFPNSYVTLQYTKTTDVAGSGSYAELGVPSVHYDDTERVIGTWFGETLYRRSFTGTSSANFSTAAILADTGENTVIRKFDGLIDGRRALNSYSGADDTYTWVTSDLHRIANYAKGASASKSTIVTIEYTKTTS